MRRSAAATNSIITATTPQPVVLPSGEMSRAATAALQAAVEGPVLTGLQAQGDVLVIPNASMMHEDDLQWFHRRAQLVRGAGAVVLKSPSRAGRPGHAHVLMNERGKVWWAPLHLTTREGSIQLGMIYVTPGAVARLVHTAIDPVEHDPVRIGHRPLPYFVQGQTQGSRRRTTRRWD